MQLLKKPLALPGWWRRVGLSRAGRSPVRITKRAFSRCRPTRGPNPGGSRVAANHEMQSMQAYNNMDSMMASAMFSPCGGFPCGPMAPVPSMNPAAAMQQMQMQFALMQQAQANAQMAAATAAAQWSACYPYPWTPMPPGNWDPNHLGMGIPMGQEVEHGADDEGDDAEDDDDDNDGEEEPQAPWSVPGLKGMGDIDAHKDKTMPVKVQLTPSLETYGDWKPDGKSTKVEKGPEPAGRVVMESKNDLDWLKKTSSWVEKTSSWIDLVPATEVNKPPPEHAQKLRDEVERFYGEKMRPVSNDLLHFLKRDLQDWNTDHLKWVVDHAPEFDLLRVDVDEKDKEKDKRDTSKTAKGGNDKFWIRLTDREEKDEDFVDLEDGFKPDKCSAKLNKVYAELVDYFHNKQSEWAEKTTGELALATYLKEKDVPLLKELTLGEVRLLVKRAHKELILGWKRVREGTKWRSYTVLYKDSDAHQKTQTDELVDTSKAILKDAGGRLKVSVLVPRLVNKGKLTDDKPCGRSSLLELLKEQRLRKDFEIEEAEDNDPIIKLKELCSGSKTEQESSAADSSS